MGEGRRQITMAEVALLAVLLAALLCACGIVAWWTK